MRLRWLVCGLLLALPTSAAAATSNTDTTVEVVEPALSVSITDATLSFGANRTSEAYYDSGGLTVTVTDPASDLQATTGWNLTAVASDVVSGPNTITAENVKFHRATVMAALDSGGDQTQDQPPVVNAGLPGLLNPLDAPLKIVTAAGTNTSKGSFQLVFPGDAFQLYLPGNTPGGTYTGSMTLTISRGI